MNFKKLILILALIHNVFVKAGAQNIVVDDSVPKVDNEAGAQNTEAPSEPKADNVEEQNDQGAASDSKTDNVAEAQDVGVTASETKTDNVAITDPKLPEVREIKNDTIEEYFAVNKIVPAVIPVAPKTRAIVIFANDVQVSFGNQLTPTQVKDMPKVTWDATPDEYYTLFAIDPDLPSGALPLYRSTLHWCVVNILGFNVTSGVTTAEYIGAVPPANTGLHRFIFLVYQQPGIINTEGPKLLKKSAKGRHMFSPEQFARKYNLTGPVAGNFFQTSFDDYVPVVLEKLASHATTVEPKYLIIFILYMILLNGY